MMYEAEMLINRESMMIETANRNRRVRVYDED